jgi:antitoxin component of MazEF toxin-antitoxin module
MNYIRKLQTVGANKTYTVSLPKDMVKKLKWKKGQKVIIELKKKKMIIQDWK